MKNILLLGALLLSFVTKAQYFVYGFNIVPEDEVNTTYKMNLSSLAKQLRRHLKRELSTDGLLCVELMALNPNLIFIGM